VKTGGGGKTLKKGSIKTVPAVTMIQQHEKGEEEIGAGRRKNLEGAGKEGGTRNGETALA